MPIQNISAVMADTVIAQFKTSLATTEGFIPSLVTLTETERTGLQSIGAERFSFVTEALLGAKNNTNVVPGFLSVTEWEKDLNYWKALDDVKLVLEKLLGKVSDTQRAVGSEAYRQARKFYVRWARHWRMCRGWYRCIKLCQSFSRGRAAMARRRPRRLRNRREGAAPALRLQSRNEFEMHCGLLVASCFGARKSGI